MIVMMDYQTFPVFPFTIFSISYNVLNKQYLKHNLRSRSLLYEFSIPEDAPIAKLVVGMLVSVFIVNHGWNVDKVCSMFPLSDVIVSIPLSRRQQNDPLVWHFESKGRYKVRSNYEVAMDFFEEH